MCVCVCVWVCNRQRSQKVNFPQQLRHTETLLLFQLEKIQSKKRLLHII